MAIVFVGRFVLVGDYIVNSSHWPFVCCGVFRLPFVISSWMIFWCFLLFIVIPVEFRPGVDYNVFELSSFFLI